MSNKISPFKSGAIIILYISMYYKQHIIHQKGVNRYTLRLVGANI